jgi:hypothetical protein
MKRTLLCLTVFLIAFAGSLRAEKNPADYPMKVTILERRGYTTFYRGYDEWHTGEGKADLQTGDTLQGFDYSYECDYNLPMSAAGEYIPAKWNKQGESLKILMGEIGKPGKYHECEMKVTLLAGVYRRGPNGGVVAVSAEQYQAQEALNHPADTNPADFPLRVALVQSQWQRNAVAVAGSGSGNVKDGDKVNGFDWSAECSRGLRASAPGGGYHGRWLQGSSNLEILVRANTPDGPTAFVCDLHASMRDYVYIRYASGQLETYTAAQYATWVKDQMDHPDQPPNPLILELPFRDAAPQAATQPGQPPDQQPADSTTPQ